LYNKRRKKKEEEEEEEEEAREEEEEEGISFSLTFDDIKKRKGRAMI